MKIDSRNNEDHFNSPQTLTSKGFMGETQKKPDYFKAILKIF
jgi:hypothetical protein